MRRSCKEVSWSEVKDQVKQANITLYEAVEKITGSADFKLIKATYAFGDLILENGKLNLPISEQSVIPSDNPKIPPHLQQHLNYSKIPMFLVLKKAVEVFIDTGSRVIPLNIFRPGHLLGLFETLDALYDCNSSPMWNASAGAKTLFSLPKINENSGLKRLQLEFNLPNVDLFRNFDDHWQHFVTIANHPKLHSDWACEILFFTENWFNKKNDPIWISFYDQIYSMAWKQAQFSIGAIELSLNWHIYAEAIAERRLKPPPYLADQIKHLFNIMAGRWPAFRPLIDKEIAPIDVIQYALIEIYRLKKYIPSLMCIYTMKTGEKTPGYYSMSYPTLLEGTPNKKISSTIMLDLRNIKKNLDTIRHYHSKSRIIMNSLFEQAIFEYFHVDHDNFGEILQSVLIPENDSTFLLEKELFPEREFCSNSSFWRGCIRITI